MLDQETRTNLMHMAIMHAGQVVIYIDALKGEKLDREVAMALAPARNACNSLITLAERKMPREANSDFWEAMGNQGDIARFSFGNPQLQRNFMTLQEYMVEHIKTREDLERWTEMIVDIITL